MEEKRHVRKSNIFVEGRYRFGVIEQKILLAIISKIRINDKEFQPYRVSWADLKELSRGYIDSTAKVDESCEKLKNKTIKLRRGKVQDNFRFLSGWSVLPGAYAEFRIDPSMKELLLDLLEEGSFTLYKLECILGLGSAYSIRIYEILKSKQWKKGYVRIDLDDLKWSLGIDEKSTTYDKFGIFRVQILDKAKKDLERHTDVKFEYETIKHGRRIVAINFKISENKKYQKTVQAVATARDFVKDGDTVVIAGKEYVVEYGCVMMKDGSLPIGRLNSMVKKGKAFIK